MMLRIAFFILVINQTFAWDFDPMRISKANKAKEQASEAFAKKNYDVAISRYKYLLDTLKVKDEKAQLNLAHCYMRKADYTNAQNYYTSATRLTDSQLRSVAFQQLGILASEKENKEDAIANFKNALRSNPANEQARFNYELMVKNKKQESPKSDDKKDRDKEEKKNKDEEKKKDDQKKDDQKKKDEQDKKDQQNKENKDDKKGGDKDDQNKDGKKDDKNGKDDLKQKPKEDDKGKPDDKNKDGKPDDKKEDEKKPGEKKEGEGNKGKENKPDEKGEKKDNVEKPSEKGEQQKKAQEQANRPNKEQLQKMNMTEQQAKAILNAMRQGEAQYIQEMKRTSAKPNPSGNKKDW
jgi:hypothetical protein